MKFEAVTREVWANVRSGTARIVTLALLGGIVSAGFATADAVSLRRLIADATVFRESGAATLTLIAEGRVDGSACRALGDVRGVTAAGALRRRDAALVATTLPSSPVDAYETTPGFSAVLGSGGQGVVVAVQVAEALGLGGTARMAAAEGDVQIGGTFTYPDDGRRPGFGWAAMIETADDRPFDECWVLVWPQSDAVRTLLPGVASAATEPPQIAQLNSTLGARFDGETRLAERITSWSFALSALLMAVLAFASVRGRRLALASDLHAGARRRDIAGILLLEGAFWLTPVLLTTVGVTALIATPESALDRGALLVQGARVAAGSFAGGCVGLAAGALSVREGGLLRYFKDR